MIILYHGFIKNTKAIFCVSANIRLLLLEFLRNCDIMNVEMLQSKKRFASECDIEMLALLNYCKDRWISPEELTDVEISRFRIKPGKIAQ
jgi:hypothetical protein